MSTNKPLKIAFLLDTSLDPNDGVQQYVLSLGQWFTSKGHEVSYLVGETKNRQINNVYSLSRNLTVTFNGNTTTVPLPTPRRKLKQFLNNHSFDVMHVQTPHSPFLTHKLIKLAPDTTTIIGTFHILPYGRLARLGNKLLGIWLRSSLNRVDKMLAVSSSAKDFCQSTFNINAEVLPNVVDYQRYNLAPPLSKFEDDKINVLFLGRLVKRKGCQQLIQAVALLDKNLQNKIRLVVCGRGPLQQQLKKQVREFGIDNIVNFEGYVTEEDKPSYYASADIAVFPSISGESFGIVLLEAMANGKAAVLGGNNPGYATVLAPKNELLFDPLDAKLLANKLEELIEDAQKRKELAEWGGQYCKNFDVNTVGQKLELIYSEQIAKKQTFVDN